MFHFQEAPLIAMVSRGGCDFNQKTTNVALAGAVGAIIYNDREEQLRTISVKDHVLNGRNCQAFLCFRSPTAAYQLCLSP